MAAYVCTQNDFLNSQSGQVKIQAIKNNINPFYSWYLNERFLKAFYYEVASPPYSASLPKCYERLLDFFVNAKLMNQINDSETLRLAKELDLLKSIPNPFDNIGDLLKYVPIILVLVGVGYFINAVKK